MSDKLLEAGKIVNTFGVRGEVKIQPWADSPSVLAGAGYIYINGEPVKMLSARIHKDFVIASLEGVADIDAAIGLKNKTVYIDRDCIRLEEGRHFVADILGLRAVDADTGEEYGTIVDILPLPSNNVYVIKGAREILVPSVSDFVIETNITAGYISFRLIEGM